MLRYFEQVSIIWKNFKQKDALHIWKVPQLLHFTSWARCHWRAFVASIVGWEYIQLIYKKIFCGPESIVGWEYIQLIYKKIFCGPESIVGWEYIQLIYKKIFCGPEFRTLLLLCKSPSVFCVLNWWCSGVAITHKKI